MPVALLDGDPVKAYKHPEIDRRLNGCHNKDAQDKVIVIRR